MHGFALNKCYSSRAYANVGPVRIPFFARFLRYKMLLLQAVYTCTPWSNSLFCTVLGHKTLFFQCLHQCRHQKNSFSFAVRVKMRVYKQAWR